MQSNMSYGLQLAAAAMMAAGFASVHADDKIEFNRDIRPILVENCFSCHGPDGASRKADLRLDDRAAAIRKGAWIPGKPDDSEGIRRVLSPDADERMPPPDSHKKLTDAQKSLLKRWVEQGAEHQAHWAFLTPKKAPPPEVQNKSWVRNPIDRFVLKRLEKEGLQPAPEADRRTLARRASFDITGLPPSPADVEAFVNDSLPDAYERFLDRLMALPQWGEHRGRHWLDYARYADTHGIHFDNYREMWSYRDWVIQAFNANQPFDRFTIEQLAGDLIPNATLEQRIASGFNRCNITTNEGGAINEEYLVLYTRDRTETVSQVWLGLTAGCAVCHEHKFDPLSQREFYEMAAFFNNTTQAAMDGNIKDTPPVVFVPLATDRSEYEKTAAALRDLDRRLEDRKVSARPDFERWAAKAQPAEIAATNPSEQRVFRALLSEGAGENLRVAIEGKTSAVALTKEHLWGPGITAEKALQPSPNAARAIEIPGVGDFELDRPFSVGVWVYIGKRNQTGSVLARMDDGNGYRGWDLWYEQGRIGTHLVHHWPGNAIKVVSNVELPIKSWQHVLFTYDGSKKAAGVRLYLNGRPQPVSVHVDTLNGTLRTGVPLKFGQRHLNGKLDKMMLQDVQLFARSLNASEAMLVATAERAAHLVAKRASHRKAAQHDAAKSSPNESTVPATAVQTTKASNGGSRDKRQDAEEEELFTWWIAGVDEEYKQLQQKRTQTDQLRMEIEARGTKAHVMNEKQTPAMAHVLFRGEYDQRRDEVKPKTPSMLPPMPDSLPRNRLGFAQWLLLPEHPLTARVTVNRFWQEVFGSGLVRTVGDFGISGEAPTHPELLDWLAIEFRESGWDVKKLFKLMLTSAAYRQSAAATREKLEKDPDNRLMSRGPRFRMDAEMIRDAALAASGLMSGKIGGPSVKPYQPDGVWEAVAMMESNTRYYKRDSGENLYRRSLYTLWKRAAPPALMDTFNAPSRETACVRRERTNTPLQALATLNDTTFVEAAKALADKALRETDTEDSDRLRFISERLLARPLTEKETAIAKASLTDLSAHYREHLEDAKKLLAVGEYKVDGRHDPAALAAWTMLANQLMNLDETLNK